VNRQPKSCWRCRTWTPNSNAECWNCQQNAKKLAVPAVPLDMISLYEKHSQMRQWLTCYKGRLDGSEPFVPEYIEVVKAFYARYFHEHGSRLIERSPIDVITVVPSSSRPAPHPLESLLGELPLTVPVVQLLERGPGELDWNKPSKDGFRPLDATPLRVLLVDDVSTTGARINSAAYALSLGGHHIAGALVAARRLTPDYRETAELWNVQKATPFTWEHGPLVNPQLLI
jgi:predicted amidophosphoribosyltransferase